ncbi:MAG: siroheme synthase, partial [Moraxella osloensis]|nr:siroheme synthase [Moraxella osloensis]
MPSISSPVSVELFPHDSVKENRFDLLITPKHAKAVQNQGKVYLVGAGTGDPELLTIKAYKTILQADVICYDNLVSDEILALNTTAEKIYV